MIPDQRHLFTIPDDVTYLNCAYVSPLSHRVVAAGEDAVRWKASPWTIGPEDFFEMPTRARALAASLVGASPDDMAIVPAASYGLAAAAKNLALEEGQCVVVLEDQFPSNVYVWREKARAVGAHVRTVERPEMGADGLWSGWTRPVLEAIDASTGIVALPQCHWSDGGLIDLVEVSRRCREVGAALVLDLSQSAGASPIDLSEIDPDFAVMVTYKWMMGPYGMGFLYVAPRHRCGEPLEYTWLGREGARDFANLVNYRDAYAPGAERFDVGQRSHLQLMPMTVAALEQLHDWGIEPLHRTLSARNAALASSLRALGCALPPDALRAGHYLAVGLPERAPRDLAERLRQENVFVSFRGASMRVTPHLYNTQDDLDRFVDVLATILGG